ncbi:MAG: tetraacyldisaccharide 4'-kinase [Cytophaga sp.]|uniref:tetraacyldisaccharide 4'-kinase n=1 Tax=Cytophaga sp. TaxID=29535 RepID=UPI003F822228
MIFLKILAWPFSILYGAIASCRNYLYDLSWFKSYLVPAAVICVGNLKAGGTGKTPFTQFLLDHFSASYKTAVLSRGYGRKTTGFVLANVDSTAAAIGDEPLQLYTHAAGRYHVAVCEDRVAGAQQLLQQIPGLQLIILDDGFQHRRIKRDVNILLTEYKDPFYKDYVLPTGMLREFRRGAARADLVVVTKSPVAHKPLNHEAIHRYARKQIPVHYTAIQYGAYTKSGQAGVGDFDQVILVTGIANSGPLLEYLAAKGIQVIEHINKKDHYNYTETDLKIVQELQQRNPQAQVLTTEKDWVKVVPLFNTCGIENTWMYIPIDLLIHTNREELLSVINTKITQRLKSLINHS